MKITNKKLHKEPAIVSSAQSLRVGMYFRFLPHGRESRRQWYVVTSVNNIEIIGKPISGSSPTVFITPGNRVMRLLSQDPALS